MVEELRNSLTVQYMLRGMEEMLQSKNSQYVGLQELTPPPANAAHKRHRARRGGQ